MGYDPVPWVVGGGAEHSPEVARQLAYAATGGFEGVGGDSDLKVTALGTPGASVSIARGVVTINNRYTTATQESYIARMATPDTVAITATGAGAGRTDLIAVQIMDPFAAGSTAPNPTNPKVGPYVRTLVVPNVSANVKRLQDVSGYATATGVALAKVTLPASTSAITNAMITDLRDLANMRTQSLLFTANSTGAGKNAQGAYVSPNGLTSATFITWPSVATWNIDVPLWATRAVVTIQVLAAATRGGDHWGETRASLGGQTTAMSAYDINSDGANPQRVSIGAGGSIAVPLAMRGTTQTLRMEALRTTGSAGHLTAQAGVTTIAQVFFSAGVV